MHAQRVLDALGDRQTKQVVRRRETIGCAARATDHDLVRLDLGLAAAVRLQQRQVHGDDLARRGDDARFDLVADPERCDHRRMMFGLRGGRNASVGGNGQVMPRTSRRYFSAMLPAIGWRCDQSQAAFSC